MSTAPVTDSQTSFIAAIDCEIAVLPVDLLLSLQRSHFLLKGKNIQISQEAGAGYNVISNGQISLEGQQFSLANCIQRKVTLTSLSEHRSFQQTILSKPMVFFTNVMVTDDSTIVFAVIVNVHHPRMQFEIGDTMNDAISTAVGASYVLQFNLKKALQSYFSLNGGFKTDGLGLDFTCEFKRDASSDAFFWLGRSTKIKELNGKIVNLSCSTEDEKCQVKQVLEKMCKANIGVGSATQQCLSRSPSQPEGSPKDQESSSPQSQPHTKRKSPKKTSSAPSLELPLVNEKSYLLQFTQRLPKYIE